MRWYVLGTLILVFTLVLRVMVYGIVTSDYTYFVRVWFATLAHHPGLTAFRKPFSDYAPTYLYLLKILTFFRVPSLDSIKTLSALFDLAVALIGSLIIGTTNTFKRRKDVRFIGAVILFSLPTVIMNSSLWGQSDAVYASGVLFSLWAILVDSPVLAALAFGFAISVKVQAIFFAPVLVGYLLRRRTTWKYLFVPPGIFLLSVIPAWLSGGNLGYWLFIYLKEAGEYPYLSVSAQSIFAFAQPLGLSAHTTSILFWTGMSAAAIVALVIVYMVAKMRVLSRVLVMRLTLASTLILPYLLPRMHERYFYLADVISTVYAFFAPRRAFIPVFVVVASTLAYMPFLSSQVAFLSDIHVDLRIPAALLLVPIAFILYDLNRTVRTGRTADIYSATS